jgi:hypothetical protein
MRRSVAWSAPRSPSSRWLPARVSWEIRWSGPTTPRPRSARSGVTSRHRGGDYTSRTRPTVVMFPTTSSGGRRRRFDRFHFVAGNLQGRARRQAFDLLHAGHLCTSSTTHLGSAGGLAAGWLASGGPVTVIDILYNEWRDSSWAVAHYDVGLVKHPTGRAGSIRFHAGCLQATSRSGPIELRLPPFHTLVRARRRGGALEWVDCVAPCFRRS